MRNFTLTCLFALSTLVSAEVAYSPQMLPLILQDIYQELQEEGVSVDFEDVETNLLQLADNPINLNAATEEDLRQLLFLSDDQIDAILLFVYKSPLSNLYQLRLVPGLTDYEIRNMLPFVVAGSIEEKKSFYWKEMWHYAKHETALRFDARNIENNQSDPFYASLRYKFNYKQKVDFGVVLERDPHEPLYVKHKTYGADFYGGWLQINDLWHFKRIVAGDYRVSFGQGLVINMNLAYGGKAAYLYRRGLREQGMRRKASSAEYDFLRGAGATLNFSIADISVFYSARKLDGRLNEGAFPSIQKTGYHRTDTELEAKRSVWHQVLGANLTLNLNKLRLGFTATETFLSDTLHPRSLYYNQNYFRGIRQAALGINYDWQIWRLHLFGEIATAQNTRWGIANLTGLRLSPVNGMTLTAVYRYYSPTFDNLQAAGFAETSKINDENGAYLGIETSLLTKWKFAAYGDYFYFSAPKYGIKTRSQGFEVYTTADYFPSQNVSMQWKFRMKRKGNADKYTLRYIVNYTRGGWVLKSGVEGNVVTRQDSAPTLGGVVYQQVEYHWQKVPISLQTRLEAFYAKHYDNCLYAYENDVLYAFSIPQLYGAGGRWYVNFRYKINSHVSLYLKASQTIFSDETVENRSLGGRTQTEIHSFIRFQW